MTTRVSTTMLGSLDHLNTAAVTAITTTNAAVTATGIDKHQEETLGEFLSNLVMEMNSEERDNIPFFYNQLFSLCEYRHNTSFYYREKWIFRIVHCMSMEEEAMKEADKVEEMEEDKEVVKDEEIEEMEEGKMG